jgi:hypothetical protein
VHDYMHALGVLGAKQCQKYLVDSTGSALGLQLPHLHLAHDAQHSQLAAVFKSPLCCAPAARQLGVARGHAGASAGGARSQGRQEGAA